MALYGTSSNPLRGRRWSALLAGTLLLLATGASGVRGQPVTGAAILNYSGPDRQRMLEEGARKEGELLLYTTGTQIAPLMNQFAQKYPFIRLKFFRAGSSEVAQRVTLEYKASFFAVDAFELGSDGLLVPRAQGVLQPFTSPEMAAYPANAMDAQRLWVSARESYGGLSYNTKLIAPADAPKSWTDLLKPRYRGNKMAFPGSTTTSAEWTGVLLTTYGEDFVRKLGQQDIRVYKMTARALQNLVSSGEVAIAARASNAHVAEDRRKGAPVEWVVPGPVAVTSTVAAIAARPPHPHAAMLMIDFLISEEGQRMYQGIGYNSARKGLEDRDTPMEKIYFTQRPTFVDDFEKWAELFRTVFVNKR
jgi:iron(III) transport system substrate-binding protein